MKRASKTLTVAIIIPVYNEGHRINACLDAIAAQTDKPEEVIVVDNNCTDDTVAKAKKYPFVKVVKETVQGAVAARNKGFNTAKSDILGRIDADSQLSSDWVQVLRGSFDDPEIDGVTGPGYSLLLPRIRRPMTLLWSKLYFVWTEMFFRVPVMWGANMAIRRTAWQKIATDVCLDGKMVHEDHDISLVLQAYAGKVKYIPKLTFTSYSQAYHYFPKLLLYTLMRHTGRDYHRTIGTLDRLEHTVPHWKSFIMYAVGWPIIGLFFTASFLAWPIDLLMKVLGKQRSWLS